MEYRLHYIKRGRTRQVKLNAEPMDIAWVSRLWLAKNLGLTADEAEAWLEKIKEE
jgi:hypothetical protein